MYQCSVCGSCSFPSRNKLFQHLKFCKINRNPNNALVQSDEEVFAGDPTKKFYLYATGGRLRGKTLLNAERYDFARNVWEPIANMCDHRGSHGGASIDPYVYAVGGGGLDTNLTSMERFDPYSNRWTLVSNMPTPRHALNMISINHLLFAIGGWAYGTVSCPQVEIYNSLTDSWSTGAHMITPRRLMGVTALDNCIYTFGGNVDELGMVADHTEIYYINEDRWISGPPLPKGSQASAVTIKGFIYVAIHGDTLYRFCPTELTFTKLCTQLPRPRWFNFEMVAFNDRIYILGGNIEGVWSPELWRYDVFTDTWEQKQSMNQERRRCAACVVEMDLSAQPSTLMDVDGEEVKEASTTAEKRSAEWHGTIRKKRRSDGPPPDFPLISKPSST